MASEYPGVTSRDPLQFMGVKIVDACDAVTNFS